MMLINFYRFQNKIMHSIIYKTKSKKNISANHTSQVMKRMVTFMPLLYPYWPECPIIYLYNNNINLLN